jgi:cytochrome c-type biogenesis protein CcmH/NrfG
VAESPGPQDNRFKQVLSLQLKVGDNPKDAAAWASLGHAYFDMDAFENAIRAYRRHLELNPDNADVWTDLGVMFRRSGKPQEAIKAFDKAAAIDPQHRQSRFNKGVVFLHDLQEPAEALKAWEELLEIYPDAKAPTGRSLKELVEQLRRQTGSTNNR